MESATSVLLKSYSISAEQAIAEYGSAQGNILNGHGRTHSVFLFVEFKNSHKAKTWLQDLLAMPSGQGGITLMAQ